MNQQLKNYGFEDKAEYSLAEISQKMGTPLRTLQGYCSDGRLPALRRSRSYYVKQADLIDYLENGISRRIPPLKKKLLHELEKTAYYHNLNVNDLIEDLIQKIKTEK